MRLTTPRLVLREFVEADWVATHEYEADPIAVRYTTHGLLTPEQCQQRVLDSIASSREEPRVIYDFAITLDDRLIGRCGFRRGPDMRIGELWFVANPRCWGQGYVTEAVRAMIDFAFSELELHRLFGDCDPRNLASARVMEKVGMQREAHLRENLFAQGEWCDSWIYGLLRREWAAGRAAPVT